MDILKAASIFHNYVKIANPEQNLGSLKDLTVILGSNPQREDLSQALAYTLYGRVNAMPDMGEWPLTNPTGKQLVRSFYYYARDLMGSMRNFDYQNTKGKLDLVKRGWGDLKASYITEDFLNSLMADQSIQIQGKSRYQWWRDLVKKIEETITSMESLLSGMSTSESESDPTQPAPEVTV